MAEDRRTLLKVLTGVIGGGAALSVAGPGLRAVLAPLGKLTVSGSGEFVEVARLEAVPEDGTPLNVPVVLEAPKDAWTRLPPTTVGAVFLLRREGKLTAFSTICPHLGCGIDFSAEARHFACPCHESSFALDGSVAAGPSPRGMDELETRVVDGRVEVRFAKFKTGTADKVLA
jgi:menaquinol-cytochrome c reductase iron-sulfur subunit